MMSVLIQQVLETINANTPTVIEEELPAVPKLTTNKALSIQNLLAK